MTSALDIYQDHLDRVSRALWDLDFEVLMSALALPNRMATEDAQLVYTTEEDLRAAILDYRGFLGRAGAQDYHRVARHARFHPDTDSRIDGEHDTYMLRGGQYTLPPFLSAQVLVLQDGQWRGIECRSLVRNSTCTVLSPDALMRLRQGTAGAAAGGTSWT